VSTIGRPLASGLEYVAVAHWRLPVPVIRTE